MQHMIKTLSIELDTHPVKEWEEGIKKAYHVVLRDYLDKVEIDEIKNRWIIYKSIIGLDTDQVELDYNTARKQIKKRYYVQLKGQIKCKALYPKYILWMDLLWITQGKLSEELQDQFMQEYSWSKTDIKCMKNIWYLIENDYVEQVEIYFNECMKYQKYKEVQYYVNQLINQRKQKEKKEVKVAVIATMSAGKSTFMNVITQLDVFPSQNQACTAKITTCKYNRYIDHIVGCAHKEDGSMIYAGLMTQEQVKEWNSDETIKSIYLEGNIPWISKDSKYNLTFFDTPGTNYSQDITHQKLTFDFIKEESVDIILYLINATQIATEDDKFLLQTVAKSIRDKETRIVFLVNKVDQFDLEGDDNLEQTLQGLNKYIEGCGINEYDIMPISAYAAKLFNRSRLGVELARKERRDKDELLELFNEPVYDLRQYYEFQGCSSYPKDELEKGIEKTNIPVVECILQAYLDDTDIKG